VLSLNNTVTRELSVITLRLLGHRFSVSIFKAAFAMFVCGCLSSLKKLMKLPSIARNIDDVFFSSVVLSLPEAITQHKGATEL
jgi:hypothetical protein